jgi:hypothetical protein
LLYTRCVPSSKVLLRAYARLNKRWFSNELPADTIVVWAPAASPDMAATNGTPNGRKTIAINKRLRRWSVAWEMTLLHEMMHVATWDEAAMHGTRWKKLRHKLVHKDAFTAYI